MKCRSMVGTLFLFMMLATVGKQAHAVETTFGAGVTTNPDTRTPIDIREVISVTLSSPNSVWYQNDFHADNSTTQSFFAVYGVSHQSTSQDILEFGNTTMTGGGGVHGMANGTYNCWAIAHGYNFDNGTTRWDAGVTSVTVRLNYL